VTIGAGESVTVAREGVTVAREVVNGSEKLLPRAETDQHFDSSAAEPESLFRSRRNCQSSESVQKPGGIEPKNKLSEKSARFKVLGSFGKTDSMLLFDKSRVCKFDKCKKESLATNVNALSLRSTYDNSDGSFGRVPDTPVDETIKVVRFVSP
jgi:hypothetical protein